MTNADKQWNWEDMNDCKAYAESLGLPFRFGYYGWFVGQGADFIEAKKLIDDIDQLRRDAVEEYERNTYPIRLNLKEIEFIDAKADGNLEDGLQESFGNPLLRKLRIAKNKLRAKTLKDESKSSSLGENVK